MVYRLIMVKILICFLSLLIASVALAEEIDFISMINRTPNLAKDAGLRKMSVTERQNWNVMLIRHIDTD